MSAFHAGLGLPVCDQKDLDDDRAKSATSQCGRILGVTPSSPAKESLRAIPQELPVSPSVYL
jgi:hypothetical protein